MFIGILLQVLGLMIASLPDNLRRQDSVFLLAALWIVLCLGIITAFVVLLPEYLTRSDNVDRFAYDAEYVNAITGISPDFELLFSLITRFMAALTTDTRIYFLSLFLATVAMMHVLVSYLFRRGDWIIPYFLYFNYFTFFALTTNAVRQGLGIALCSVAISYFLKDRLRFSFMLIVMASFIHTSCILYSAIFLTRIPGSTVRRLVFAVLAVFFMSEAGITEVMADAVQSIYTIQSRAIDEYTSGVWAQEAYSGGALRIDFLIFSFIPLVPYIIFTGCIKNETSGHAYIMYEKLMRVYVSLIIPFAFFSYMMFSDRYAVLAWVLIPMVVIWPLLYLEGVVNAWAIRAILLALVGIFTNLVGHQSTLLQVCQMFL